MGVRLLAGNKMCLCFFLSLRFLSLSLALEYFGGDCGRDGVSMVEGALTHFAGGCWAGI
jgi:hypothetical protein